MNLFESIYQSLEPGTDEKLFELYHENSKLTPFEKRKSLREIQEKMNDLITSYDYTHFPTITLPEEREPFAVGLEEALCSRRTNMKPSAVEISIKQLATLLHFSYGVTRSNDGTDFPHPFRMVPSAGALYPLEIYFHHNYIDGLDAGLYHYRPESNSISCIQRGDHTGKLKQAFVQPELVVNASLVVFITAVFERSFFKYGERSYRFCLLEAGHVAQNLAIAAHGLKMGCVTVGGYTDKLVDDFLMIDGVNHSTVYAVSIGGSNS